MHKIADNFSDLVCYKHAKMNIDNYGRSLTRVSITSMASMSLRLAYFYVNMYWYHVTIWLLSCFWGPWNLFHLSLWQWYIHFVVFQQFFL